MASYKLLETFRECFQNKCYLHRDSSIGDRVACRLYEDLADLNVSEALTRRIKGATCVVNIRNTTIGKKFRRGDGTFGELVPSAVALTAEGFVVARGPVANIQIGAETKILAKAMIKQIDRVIGDLKRQSNEFERTGGDPIKIAFVGINYADFYTSYEGDRPFPTDGKKYTHPIQEAEAAKRRVLEHVKSSFDELQILPFKATNAPPYPFEWMNQETTTMEYAALLLRVSREYDRRFR